MVIRNWTYKELVMNESFSVLIGIGAILFWRIDDACVSSLQ